MSAIELHTVERQPWRMCPHCGTLHDGATGNSDQVTPGAVLICSDCGGYGVTDEAAVGGWRKPTADEDRSILNDDTARRFIAAVRAVAAGRRRG